MKRLMVIMVISIISLFSFQMLAQTPTMEEKVFPQYLGGGMPTAFQVKISGLAPNTSFFCAFGVIWSYDNSSYNGDGYFFIPGHSTGNQMLRATNDYNNFNDYSVVATDGAGEMTVWVIISPSSTDRFKPGDPVYLCFVCNDGTGSTLVSHRIYSSSAITVADLIGGVYDMDANDNCVYIKGISLAPGAKYVSIYDNTLGTGRPLSCCVTENNSLDEETSSSPDPLSPLALASFYSGSINNNPGDYGLLYPTVNPNGIQKIEILNEDGSSYAAATSANGQWSGFNPASLTLGNIYTITQSDAPLPVELQTFTATYSSDSSDKVILNWKTATEVNSYAFQIQKKYLEKNWRDIGMVEAHGNSNSPKDYSFTDIDIQSGINYYRLKMIDRDGSFELSPGVSVSIAAPVRFTIGQNYPNPFNPSTSINYSIPENSFVTIKVYSILGAEVATLVNEIKPAGNYRVSFDGHKLSSGTYFYQIAAGDFLQIKKMVLMK